VRNALIPLIGLVAAYFIVSGTISLFAAFVWDRRSAHEPQTPFKALRVQLFLHGGWYVATGALHSLSAISLIKNREQSGRFFLAIGTLSVWIITLRTFSTWQQLHRTFDLIEVIIMAPLITLFMMWVIKAKPRRGC